MGDCRENLQEARRRESRSMEERESKGRNQDLRPSESDVRSNRRHERDSRSWAEKRENATQTRRELAQPSEYRGRPRVAEDCRHYVRNRWCKYGDGCKYNHPQLPERNQMRDEMAQTCPSQVRPELPESNQMRHDMPQTRPAQVRAQLPESNQMKQEMRQTSSYPVRPGAKDCEHYFNHPPNHAAKWRRRKRALRLICKFFMGGNCMNGSSCRYYHPMDTAATTSYRSSDEGRHGTESSSMAEKRARTVRDSGELDPRERPQYQQADMERQMREVQEKAQEERRQREIQRREARLRIEQMRPTAQLDNLIQIRESLSDIGIKRKEGDGF